MTRPIVIAAHGTRSDEGRRTTEAAAEALAEATGAAVTVGWIDVLEPTVDEVVVRLGDPVIVPWLVGGGFHLQVDVARAAAANPAATVLAPIGESEGLVRALVARLRFVPVLDDLPVDQPIALAWAGSRNDVAKQRVAGVAARVAEVVGRPVTPVALAAGEVEPEVALAGGPVVLTMLLAPGFFHDQLLSLLDRLAAEDRAVAGVTPPIGPHPALVAAVAEEYRAVVSTA